MKTLQWVRPRWKAVAGTAVFIISEALTFGFVPDKYVGEAQAIIGAAIYFGIFKAPRNQYPPPPRAEVTLHAGKEA